MAASPAVVTVSVAPENSLWRRASELAAGRVLPEIVRLRCRADTRPLARAPGQSGGGYCPRSCDARPSRTQRGSSPRLIRETPLLTGTCALEARVVLVPELPRRRGSTGSSGAVLLELRASGAASPGSRHPGRLPAAQAPSAGRVGICLPAVTRVCYRPGAARSSGSPAARRGRRPTRRTGRRPDSPRAAAGCRPWPGPGGNTWPPDAPRPGCSAR
jgi:hypothetical protein